MNLKQRGTSSFDAVVVDDCAFGRVLAFARVALDFAALVYRGCAVDAEVETVVVSGDAEAKRVRSL